MPDPTTPDQHPASSTVTARASRQHWPRYLRSRSTSGSQETARSSGSDSALRRRWFNAALRIGDSEVVHALRFAERAEGGERVATACHTGHDRADNSADLIPIWDQAVTCQHCQRNPQALADGQPYDPNWNHPVLPGMPPLPTWPSRNDGDQFTLL